MYTTEQVSDVFVADAWQKTIAGMEASGIKNFADWDASFCESLGLTWDLSAATLGTRGARFAMQVVDGETKVLNVEEKGKYEVSSAEALLKSME